MYNIAIVIIRFVILAVLLKGFLKKNADILSYSTAFAEYNVLKTRNKERILSLLTLTGEFLILISLLCGIYVEYLAWLGVCLQGITLFGIIKNYGKKLIKNCNCYSVTLPKNLNFRALCVNFGLIYAYVMLSIFSFWNKGGVG